MGIQSSIDIKLIGHIDLIALFRNLPDDVWKFDKEGILSIYQLVIQILTGNLPLKMTLNLF